jgi:hypothetical protein
MCMYVNICMYVCMYIYIYTYVHIFLRNVRNIFNKIICNGFLYIYIYIYIYVYTYIYIYIYIYIYEDTFIDKYEYICTNLCIYS